MTKQVPILSMKRVDDHIITVYLGKKIEGGFSAVFDTIKDPDHAKLYMAKLRKLTKFADSNVGYMTGYYNPKEMRELQKRFDVVHPIFGRNVPSAREAITAGKKIAKARPTTKTSHRPAPGKTKTTKARAKSRAAYKR